MIGIGDKLQILIDALLENQPRKTSDRYFVGDTDTILAGTQLTVTFSLSKDYVVRLVEAYADARTDCNYTWVIDGQSYTLNEVKFYLGKPITGESITLIIANTSAADVIIAYYIVGWGDFKAGG